MSDLEFAIFSFAAIALVGIGIMFAVDWWGETRRDSDR